MASRSPLRRRTARGLDLVSRLFDAAADDFELHEEDDALVLTLELPGFERDDLNVRWREGRLHVTAETEAEDDRQDRRYTRTVSLPREVDEDRAVATYRNGVLEVRLPLADGPAASGRPVEVSGE